MAAWRIILRFAANANICSMVSWLTFKHHQKVILVIATLFGAKSSPLFLPNSSSSLKTVGAAYLPLYTSGSSSKLAWIIRIKVV